MATPYSLRAYEGWMTRNRRTWRSAFAYAVLGPLLSLCAMGFGLGVLVTERSPEALGGVPYRLFLAPGLLAAATMQMAVGEATWPVLDALRWNRAYHSMLAAPLAVTHVLYGHLLWMATRLTVAAAAFLAAAFALGLGASATATLALPAAVLTGAAFAAPITAWAIGRQSEQSFATLYRVVVMPLYLFSGTFFPLDTLPVALRALIRVAPLWHGVELCRGAVLGGLTPGRAALHVGYLLAVTCVGVAAGRRAFAKALAS